MLAGLLRLRRRGGGTFEIGRLLWKQVRAAILPGCDVIDIPIDAFRVRKGLIWFTVATIAEFVQAVSVAGRLAHRLLLIPVFSVAVLDFEYRR